MDNLVLPGSWIWAGSAERSRKCKTGVKEGAETINQQWNGINLRRRTRLKPALNPLQRVPAHKTTSETGIKPGRGLSTPWGINPGINHPWEAGGSSQHDSLLSHGRREALFSAWFPLNLTGAGRVYTGYSLPGTLRWCIYRGIASLVP